MMHRTSQFAAALVVVGLLPLVAHGQQPSASQSLALDPVLVAESRISIDSARAIAVHRVKHAKIASEELEREHGRLIYSFDMKVEGTSGIQEVNVSAITGAVIGVHHESAATEAREAHEDSVSAAKHPAVRATPRG